MGKDSRNKSKCINNFNKYKWTIPATKEKSIEISKKNKQKGCHVLFPRDTPKPNDSELLKIKRCKKIQHKILTKVK